MNDARVAAARVLAALDLGRTTLATQLERERPATHDPRDQALYQELVLGTTRWRAELDARLKPHLRRSIDSLAPAVRAILRLAAYQLLHLTRVPSHAVVNESVESTRALGHARAAGFVNAVLRNLIRGGRRHTRELQPAPLSELATALSHPEWLVERWMNRAGFEGCVRWCEFNNAGGAVTVRPIEGDSQTVRGLLREEGLEAEPARYVRDAIYLPPGALGRVSPSLRDRLVIQDEGAQLVAIALGATPGDRVLDVCAAPGGKATLLAKTTGPAGFVVACDHRPARVALLAETISRAKLHTAVVALDAEGPLPFRADFDRVLLDVPCSGLGVVRREPDIKWNRAESSLRTFARAQQRMIQHAADVVRPGGTLLYATCSSEPEENDDVVERFLRDRPDFTIDPIVLPAGLVHASGSPLVEANGFFATRPDVHQLDAYFAARLVRRNPA